MPAVKDVRSQLWKAAGEEKIPHAVLFEGENGTGKKETALWLTQMLLCTGENAPCGKCAACRKTESGNHPDVSMIVPEGKKSSIGIDDIRKIKETLYLLPNEGRRKIYIIPGADCMTPEAQNAFLKSLEEPPEDVCFILTCCNRDMLLDTIISRTAVYTFSPLTAEECAGELLSRYPDIGERMAGLLSMAYDGSYGAAAEAAADDDDRGMVSSASDIPGMLRQGKLYDAALLISSHTGDRNSLGKFFGVFGNLVAKSAVEKAAGRKYDINIQPAEAVKIRDIIQKGTEATALNGSVDLIINWFVAECARVFGIN